MSSSLTPGQVEQLQNQVRLFKSLGKRYADSVFMKSIQELKELRQQQQQQANSNGNAVQGIVSSASSTTLGQQSHLQSMQPSQQQVPQLGQQLGQPIGHMPQQQAQQQAQQHAQQLQATKSVGLPSNSAVNSAVRPSSIVGPASSTSLPSTNPSSAPTPSSMQGSNPSNSESHAPPALSWQCFYSVLFTGPSRPTEGMIAIPPGEIGSFSKAASLPLVLTLPHASTIREKLLSDYVNRAMFPAPLSLQKAASGASNASQDQSQDDSLTAEQRAMMYSMLKMQREQRAIIANNYMTLCQAKAAAAPSSSSAASSATVSSIHPTPALGAGGYLLQLVPRKNFAKSRKLGRRDTRTWEKEDKRRRTEAEDKRRKKNIEFLKAVVAHREEFIRFHKAKRIDCTRTAKAAKAWQEMLESRRDREEAKAEMKRMQALKENDMVAYSKLVQETKNERLHYLINQTDSYLAAINQLVQNQRAEAEEEQLPTVSGNPIRSGVDSEAMVIDNDGADSQSAAAPTAGSASLSSLGAQSLTKASKEYYESTHKKTEKVVQPTMLKGGDLKEYQLSGLQWMVSLYNNSLNGILADEMGLGKTIQTIALISYLMEIKKNMGPFMIVVPLSTLSNWVNEIGKWAPEIIKVVYKGTPIVRKQLYKDEVESGHFNLLLTTYEYTMKDKSSLRKHQWQYIIVDEGHRMKNANSKFAQTLGTVYTSKHRLLLTGTPLQNNLPELWALLNFLLPTIFSSVDTFDQWFNKPFSSFKSPTVSSTNVNGEGEQEVATLTQEERMLIVHRLHEVLRPFMLRREKSQVLDQLPEKVERVLRCDLSGWQRKLYNVIHKRSLPLLTTKGKGGLDVEAESGAPGGAMNNAVMQLRKVCNHPYLFLDEWYIDDDLIRSSGKFELLDRMLPKLRAAGHRVLMFSQMTQVMNILERYFEYRGFLHMRLDGSTTSDERERRMFMFNDPDSPYFIFLLSTRAGGLGLNLATADTVILFDSDWNPMMDAQAQDRAHRIGQKNEVRVFRLVSTSPVEERILARATDKRTLNGLVVDAGKFNRDRNGVAQDRDREEMMQTLLKELSSGGAAPAAAGAASAGLAGDGEEGEFVEEDEAEVPNDDQINEMMATNAAELNLYRAMDVERKEKQAILAAPTGLPYQCLMGSSDSPSWLQPHHWTSRHAQLKDLMSDLPPQSGKKGKMKSTGSSGGLSDIGVGEASLYFSGDASDGDGEDSNDVVFVAGKVMRKRKQVVYDDGLTDLQFQRLMDKKLEQEEIAAKEAAAANKRGPKRPRVEISGGDSSGDLTAMSTVTTADDDRWTLDAEISKHLLAIVTEISKMKHPSGACLLAQLFLVKPDKKIYPDYYRTIANPISLKDISGKLKKSQYRNIEEVESDFALMSHNARVYNMDSSPVFHDCELIRATFYELAAKAGILSAAFVAALPPLPVEAAYTALPYGAPLVRQTSTGSVAASKTIAMLPMTVTPTAATTPAAKASGANPKASSGKSGAKVSAKQSSKATPASSNYYASTPADDYGYEFDYDDRANIFSDRFFSTPVSLPSSSTKSTSAKKSGLVLTLPKFPKK